MPRKSKEFLRRSKAAKKGWRTRRSNIRKKRRTPPRKSKWMWRVTVAAPYYYRSKKKKGIGKNESHTAAYMVRGWYRTQEQARKALPKLIKMAEGGRDSILTEDSHTWGSSQATNDEIKKVPYDQMLIGNIEEWDEHPDEHP